MITRGKRKALASVDSTTPPRKSRQEQTLIPTKATPPTHQHFKALEAELEHMEALNQVLMVKQREDSAQLAEARKLLLKGWKYMTGKPSVIGVKSLGEIPSRAFLVACYRKYDCDEKAEKKAAELVSLWQSYLADSSWYPFKIVYADGEHKEIIDDSDPKLKNLKNEFGCKVYDAVCTALNELNEYNSCGRYVVKELWNFEKGQKATLGEAITVLLRICRTS